GVDGIAFAVWAPNAERVSVVGDFNHWDGRRHPMRLRIEAGIWEIFIPGLADNAAYKFEILGYGGWLLPLKPDPFAFRSEQPPHTASRAFVAKTDSHEDDSWLERRQSANSRNAPISIYECHLGSWARKEGNRYLSYAELADRLVPYVADLGFTHLELLPIAE